ncbi:polysaccharide deacetylase family protein [Thiofilum flexile]|uniref:polysaccharide deacetylase family protein n=1 Tax=Thiofilum flexile TaxID=125627 RepID=UPI00037CA8D9|nr:polysaccharide deacetylase family protein [Thiofilum flexile]
MKQQLITALFTLGLVIWTGAAQAVDCAAVRERFQCDASTKYPLHLSFDDGPAQQTTDVLKVLKKEKIPATFFAIARKVDCPEIAKRCQAEQHDSNVCIQRMTECKQRRKILRQIKQAGHMIGSHSYAHLHYSQVDAAARRADFKRSRQVLSPYFTTKIPLFRLPYGDGWFNRAERPEILKDLQALGFRHIAWAFSAFDWNKDNQRGDKILANVLSEVCKRKQGGIVLFHDGVEEQLHEGRLFTTTHLQDWVPSMRCVVDFKPLSFFEH